MKYESVKLSQWVTFVFYLSVPTADGKTEFSIENIPLEIATILRPAIFTIGILYTVDENTKELISPFRINHVIIKNQKEKL